MLMIEHCKMAKQGVMHTFLLWACILEVIFCNTTEENNTPIITTESIDADTTVPAFTTSTQFETTILSLSTRGITQNPPPPNVKTKCDSVNDENIFANSMKVNNLSASLEPLLEQSMTYFKHLIIQQNYTSELSELARNATVEYTEVLKEVLQSSTEIGEVIKCKQFAKYREYYLPINRSAIYEQRLEISLGLLKEIDKMIDSEGMFNYTLQNEGENVVSQFEELNNIINLSVESETLFNCARKNLTKSKTSSEYWKLSNTFKEILQIDNRILISIDKYQTLRKAYDAHILKSNKTKKHIDVDFWVSHINKTQSKLEVAKEIYHVKLLNEIKGPVVLSIFIVGIIGNGTLILVFLMHKDMRTAPNFMIINLTITDTCSLIVNCPYINVMSYKSRWALGDLTCRLYRFSQYFFIGLSAYSVVVVSLIRFFLLVNIFKFDKLGCGVMGKWKSLLNLLIVWIVAAGIALPYALEANINKKGICKPVSPERSIKFVTQRSLVEFILYCLIPLFIITISSVISSHRLKQSANQMPGEAIGQGTEVKTRLLSSKILIGLTVVFAATYTPIFTYMLCRDWLHVRYDNVVGTYIRLISWYLQFFNSCINPIALYIVSRKYRKYMNRYLLCRCKETEDRETSVGSTTTVISTRL